MEIKYINKKKIKLKNHLIRSAISLAGSLAITLGINGGLPRDSKDNNIHDYNTEQVIYYDDENYALAFDSNVTNYSVEEITSFSNRNSYGQLDKVLLIDNYFITDLSCLENIYNDIKEITIRRCPSIIDLSPVYKMPNLKKVNFYEMSCVTQEFIDYLDNHNIEHNLTSEDVWVHDELQRIMNQTISSSMSKIEQIKAISSYLSNNFKYDLSSSTDSNQCPLTYFLKNESGVCISFSFAGCILFNMLGIETYNIVGDSYGFDGRHAWNLINIDDKYYYVDITNFNNLNIIDSLYLALFNSSNYFMADPGECDNKVLMNYFQDKDHIIMPKSLAMKIEEGENKKNIFERNPAQVRNYSKFLVLDFICLQLIQILIEKIIIIKKISVSKEDVQNNKVKKKK